MSIDMSFDDIILRKPNKEDGVKLHYLVRINPPLDMNSVYCNVLQCSHFRDTCIVAQQGEELIGYTTGYIMPTDPSVFFLWQIGISKEGRGKGLGLKMVEAILQRDFCKDIKELNTTITKSNTASRRMFEKFANAHGAKIEEIEEYFSQENLDGHAAESLMRIAPLALG